MSNLGSTSSASPPLSKLSPHCGPLSNGQNRNRRCQNGAPPRAPTRPVSRRLGTDVTQTRHETSNSVNLCAMRRPYAVRARMRCVRVLGRAATYVAPVARKGEQSTLWAPFCTTMGRGAHTGGLECASHAPPRALPRSLLRFESSFATTRMNSRTADLTCAHVRSGEQQTKLDTSDVSNDTWRL